MLFVPASRPDMIAKAVSAAADAVCLDLEDSVAPAEKGAARGHVVEALRRLDFGGRARVVRMNPVDTAFAYRDVVDVFEAVGDRVDLLMVPKVGEPRDVQLVKTLLRQVAVAARRAVRADAAEASPRGVRARGRHRPRGANRDGEGVSQHP